MRFFFLGASPGLVSSGTVVASGVPVEVAAPPDAVVSGPVEQYDLVLDTYCSQGIVLPRDRAAMFKLIRRSLRPHGLLLMSCVHFNPARCAEHVPPIAKLCHTPSFASE